ncbi:acyltransferase [Fulvimonas yonginensis]|uniref:Acyltransferase n=1 Tax=Fulvimonas yonginensis TaxID=1495200 RepID=A0ABU8J8W0_9GAMM
MAFLQYRQALEHTLRGNSLGLSPQAISQTISFARIVLIIGLVFLHYEQYPDVSANPFSGMEASGHRLATFVNSFTLFFFFSVVPLLSMVSGWLFYSFDAGNASASLRHRIGRRFTSIYLPMVSWNVLYLAVLALLFVWNPAYPLLGQMNIRLGHASAMDFVNAIFGITAHPVGFQFWFVRDLFVTALVSPLLWLSLKHTPYLGMAFLGVAWIIGSDLLIFFRTDVVFFFYLGGFLRIRRVPLHIGRTTSWWLLVAYLVVVTLRTVAPLFIDLGAHRPELLTAATRSMRLLGVLACWGCFQQWAQTRTGATIARFGGLAFFLHSAHYPLIAEVKILLWPLLPSHADGWLIAHYVASVAITVAIGMSVGLLLARRLPSVFALMNGGRPGTGPQGAQKKLAPTKQAHAAPAAGRAIDTVTAQPPSAEDAPNS